MQRWPGAPGGFAPRNPKVTIRRIVKSFAPYRRQVVLVLAAVFVSSLLGLLSPFFLRAIVDRGLYRGDIGLVSRFTLLTLAATIAATALSLGYGYLSVVVGQRIMRD